MLAGVSKKATGTGKASRSVGPARDVACKAVTRLARNYPDIGEADVRDKGLSANDAALAHTIVRTCVLRWATLAILCERALRRGWRTLDAPVQGALLVGSSQILFFDRVPRHAAVDESVAWTRGQAKGAAPLVNAGLRELCRMAFGMGTEYDTTTGRSVVDSLDEQSRRQLALSDGRALEFCHEMLPVDATRRFALQTGTPLALFNDWMRTHGPKRARELAMHTLAEPPICVHVVGEPGVSDPSLTPHESPDVRVLTGGVERLRELLAAHPRLWVQDAAATRAVAALREFKPRLVVDVCAGQGTKTKQLAATFPHAAVLASDPDAERAETLATVPTHFANVRVVADERLALEVQEVSGGGGADVVLLDVPCSNTGVLPRRPEAMHRPRTDQLKRLVPLQREILTRGASLLGREGVVVYSTCSIDIDENQSQTRWACESLGLELVRDELTMPAGGPGGPHAAYHDGAYHAILRRRP
jgi:16S rRNA (cytosine967-C5)-methyltransferase